MQFRADEHVYKQVAEKLRADILARKLTEKIPGERELSERYRVNFKTANKAVAVLVSEGLLARVKGKGTFVARAKDERALTLVGLSVSQLENPYFSKSVRAIERAAAREGISLLLHTPETTMGVSQPFVKTLAARGAQGLIVYGGGVPAAVRKLGLAVVCFGGSAPAGDFVYADVRDGAEQVMAHLIERFGTTIAYIGSAVSGDERADAYLRMLGAAGAKPKPNWARSGSNSYRGGYEATKALLAKPDRPRAIFFFNDYMAMGGQRAIAELGLRVPQDIAVAGFDDSVDPGEMVVPTTSVLFSFDKTAAELLRLLRRRRNHPDALPEHVTIPAELQVRRSTTR